MMHYSTLQSCIHGFMTPKGFPIICVFSNAAKKISREEEVTNNRTRMTCVWINNMLPQFEPACWACFLFLDPLKISEKVATVSPTLQHKHEPQPKVSAKMWNYTRGNLTIRRQQLYLDTHQYMFDEMFKWSIVNIQNVKRFEIIFFTSVIRFL